MNIVPNIIAPIAIITGLVFSYILKNKFIAPCFYFVGFTLLVFSSFTTSNIFVAIIWLVAALLAVYAAFGKK